MDMRRHNHKNMHRDNMHCENIRHKKTHRKNLMAATLAVLAALLGVSAMEPARAHHLLPDHTLKCSENFPCPEEIQPRVHFWIEVFRSWGKETAILHDPKQPARVYTVFNSGRGCSRVVRSTLKRKRNQVKKSLRAIAAKIESGQKMTTANERHLAALFPAKNPREIRAAANNIRCQGGVRDSFVAGLKRFKGYRGMIDDVLLDAGLPAEIRYLPFVESSYNPAAYSKAGAAGMWQIMPKTARVLGLELNATLDERLDPEAATRAAALYLRRADESLSAVARESDPAITRPQINPFIITSYNYGVSGMKRAIRQVAPDFMAVLERYKSRRFRVAVKNFYASFLAARHVAINAEHYFGVLPVDAPGEYQTVVLAHSTSIARIEAVFGLGQAALRPLNRALTRYVWRGWRLIPAGYRLRLPPKDDRWQAARTRLSSMRPEKVISGGDRYTVRRGDTACGIARAVRVNCSTLIRANQLGKNALIIPGQKLLIPRKLVIASAATAGKREPPPRPGISTTYRVRLGDTACGIAERFGVGCRTLISHNRLGRTAKIYAGQDLYIPGGVPASVQPRGLNADNQYIVRRGDSACRVAQRFSVNCSALRRLNELNASAIIHPGQKLKIPGLVVPTTSRTAALLAQVTVAPPASDAQPFPKMTATPFATAKTAVETLNALEALAIDADADALRNLLDTLPELGIRVTSVAGEPVYTVRVEADETLGHFSDWLGIGGAGRLRKLNRLRGSRSLAIGARLVLPVRDAKMVERFEQRRTDYHQVLSESLKEHYDLVGIESYTVRRGDSPWLLARQLGFPLWLLYRFNPVLHNTSLVPGQVVVLPKLKAKV